MKTLRLFAPTALALIISLFASCGDDDPVAPTPEPDNNDPAFVYTEVWQYVSDEDDDGNHDTVVMYCNMNDSTYLCSIAKHSTQYILRFKDGDCGTLQVRMRIFGYTEEERVVKPTLLIWPDGAHDAQYFIITSYDEETLSMYYDGYVNYPVFYPYVDQYEFSKINKQ